MLLVVIECLFDAQAHDLHAFDHVQLQLLFLRFSLLLSLHDSGLLLLELMQPAILLSLEVFVCPLSWVFHDVPDCPYHLLVPLLGRRLISLYNSSLNLFQFLQF